MNIILVHGAWHTAACWEALQNKLKALYTIYTINMPGRVFEKTTEYKRINLIDYVNAIEDCLNQIKEPAVLIGHSLAGLTISQIAEKFPDKIQQLIYISAFIPTSGETMFDITAKIKTLGVSSEITTYPKENRIDISPSERTKSLFYNACSDLIASTALDSLVSEPLKAFTTPVKLSTSGFGKVHKTYIKCLEDRALLPVDQNEMIEKTNISQIFEIRTDHSPFISQPQILANIIKQAILSAVKDDKPN